MHISVNKIPRWDIHFEISWSFLVDRLSYLVGKVNMIIRIIFLDSERVVAIGLDIWWMLGNCGFYKIGNLHARLQIDTSGWSFMGCFLRSAEPIQMPLLSIFRFLVFDLNMLRRYLSLFYFRKKVGLLKISIHHFFIYPILKFYFERSNWLDTGISWSNIAN